MLPSFLVPSFLSFQYIEVYFFFFSFFPNTIQKNFHFFIFSVTEITWRWKIQGILFSEIEWTIPFFCSTYVESQTKQWREREAGNLILTYIDSGYIQSQLLISRVCHVSSWVCDVTVWVSFCSRDTRWLAFQEWCGANHPYFTDLLQNSFNSLENHSSVNINYELLFSGPVAFHQ